MLRILSVLFAALLTGGAWGATLDEMGVAIDPLVPGKPASSEMAHPTRGEKEPLVMVGANAHHGTVASYLEASRASFKKNGWEIVGEQAEAEGFVIEFKGAVNGVPNHWYVKGILKDGMLRHAVGTSLESLWPEVGPKIKATVNSLRLKGAPAAAPGTDPLGPLGGGSLDELGVTISPLAEGQAPARQMVLPESDGFTPNVAVIFQNRDIPPSIPEFIKAERAALEKDGRTLIDSSEGIDFFTLEYTGIQGERVLHCYVKALIRPGRVMLATGLALDTQWPAVGEKLKACVDSFKPKPR